MVVVVAVVVANAAAVGTTTPVANAAFVDRKARNLVTFGRRIESNRELVADSVFLLSVVREGVVVGRALFLVVPKRRFVGERHDFRNWAELGPTFFAMLRNIVRGL